MSDVPIFHSLDSYWYPEAQLPRYKKLVSEFETQYGHKADFLARSPGRVNLIGEHVDYSNFPCLPLALEVDIVFAIKVVDTPIIQLRNMDANFSAKEIAIPQDGSLVEVDTSSGTAWSDYFKCGMIVSNYFMQSKGIKGPIKGLQIVVDGQVPTGSGLSSSAAFICCTALAILKVNCPEELVTKENLVGMCGSSEKYLGLNSGGMDQTASICGVKNHALFINFKPSITATPIAFPKTEEPFEFLIANSLVVSNKAVTAPYNYNLRVVEVSAAAEVLAKLYGISIPLDNGFGSGTLKGFMDTFFKDDKVTVEKLTKLLEMCEDTFKDRKEFTVEEAADAIGVSAEEFTQKFLTRNKVIFEKLKLYKRAHHVFSETLRVIQLSKLLQNSSGDNFQEEFGALMNESQKSCREDYECSCDGIDEICALALANGSTGSRLTGAGWGGCTVHLIPSSRVAQVKAGLVDKYYKKKFADITTDKIEEAIVVSRPAWGSSLFTGDL